MKLILLTQGKSAKVSDDDFDRISQFKWQTNQLRTSPIWYASRTFRINGKRKTVLMHNFIMGFKGIDHRDGDGLNNQRENLRKATPRQNGYNRRIQKHSTPFKGVTFGIRFKRFVATIQARGKRLHLGYFDCPTEAAVAYDAAARRFFGDFAKTNF